KYKKKPWLPKAFCAQNKNRTCTPLRRHGPQPCADNLRIKSNTPTDTLFTLTKLRWKMEKFLHYFSTMKIKYYLNATTNESTLRVSVYKDKTRQFKTSTKYSIQKKYWDQKNQRVRKSMDGYEQFNTVLNELKQDISKQINLQIIEKQAWNILKRNIQLYIKTGNLESKKTELITCLIDSFISDRRNEYKYETTRKYQILKTLIIKYQSKYKVVLSTSNLDYTITDSFRKYVLFDRNNRNDTAYRMIASLKCVLRWAIQNDYKIDDSTLKVNQPVKSKYEIVTLSESEIEAIATVKLSPEQERVRDCFLFQIYTGQRFSDMQQLAPEQVKNHLWVFRSVKTEKLMHIPFVGWTAEAEDIAKKYNYRFPQYSSQYFNRALKLICKNAGIDTQVQLTRYQGSRKIIIDKPKYKLISSHTGRRTAVSLLLAKGVPPTVVMKLTGHSDIRTMMKYERTTTELLEQALLKI
ncbi:MAG: site-specific integrase, partial [Candidatus Marithrix sp.]